MHFESVWMLHVLYTLLLSHTNPQVNKYITIAMHAILPALTLLAILPLQLDRSHTHSQEHGTLTHPRNELGIRKS